MGRMQAEDMKNHTDFDTAIRWHLRGNHYPPVHSDFVEPAKKAIEHCNFGEPEKEIELPNGKILKAWKIVEGLHLETWIEDYEN